MYVMNSNAEYCQAQFSTLYNAIFDFCTIRGHPIHFGLQQVTFEEICTVFQYFALYTQLHAPQQDGGVWGFMEGHLQVC